MLFSFACILIPEECSVRYLLVIPTQLGFADVHSHGNILIPITHSVRYPLKIIHVLPIHVIARASRKSGRVTSPSSSEMWRQKAEEIPIAQSVFIHTKSHSTWNPQEQGLWNRLAFLTRAQEIPERKNVKSLDACAWINLNCAHETHGRNCVHSAVCLFKAYVLVVTC